MRTEVIDRLLHKIREDQQAPKLRAALAYMQRLSALVGSPADVLDEARALAADYNVEPTGVAALEKTLAALDEHGALSGEVQLDLGLNRGLHYYTGLMFEIHGHTGDGEEIQLGGGGRYDNLVSILGGGDATPALGFAYGLERIASVLDSGEIISLNRPDVFVIPIADDDYAAAYRIATRLRANDIVVEMSIDPRNLRRSLKHADRRGADLVIIIGESERQGQNARLRDMRTGQEQGVPFEALPKVIEELLSARA